MTLQQKIYGVLRIALGFVFLWAFTDKVLGLGFSTCRDKASGAVDMLCDKAWLMGGSPTAGFLKFGTHGPLADTFASLAGNGIVDWLFMLGLLGVGTGLVLGILTRLSVWSGATMMILMYAAAMPPENNPLIDDHIIYALVLLTFLYMPVGEWYGFGKRWAMHDAVKKHGWLR